MIITFSPQVKLPDNDYLFIKVIGDILYVKYEDKEEEYDFTHMGEGELQSVESTNISIEPLFEAKRITGDLYVTLYRPIPPTNNEALNFPEEVDTSKSDLSNYSKDPLYIYLEEHADVDTGIDNEVPTEPGGEPVEEPIEEPTEPEEEEELGEPEVIKLTEHEYSKEENIDYTPIVDEVLSEHELEPVPEIEVPEPIEPDDDLLKTPEFTDIETALEQAYLEEEERRLQEELARQRELQEKLMEEQLEGLLNGEDKSPLEFPMIVVPTEEDSLEEEPTEPKQGDEESTSEDLEVDEYDYTSDEETALEGNTELNSEVDNNG